MDRVRNVVAIAAVAVAGLVLVGAHARATDAGCTRWEVKMFPVKVEHEKALRVGNTAGPLAIEEGWEPFGTVQLAVAARRCAR